MENAAVHLAQEEGIADILWRRLRSTADRLIEQRAGLKEVDSRVRGEIYLFIVDLIARWVDRIEQNGGTVDVEAMRRMLRAGMAKIRDRMNGLAVARPATP
jgi:hypothetical protein